MVQSARFRVYGLECRVYSLGRRVYGLECRVYILGCRGFGWGSNVKVYGLRVWGSGLGGCNLQFRFDFVRFKVGSLTYRVRSLGGFKVSLRMTSNTEDPFLIGQEGLQLRRDWLVEKLCEYTSQTSKFWSLSLSFHWLSKSGENTIFPQTGGEVRSFLFEDTSGGMCEVSFRIGRERGKS